MANFEDNFRAQVQTILGEGHKSEDDLVDAAVAEHDNFKDAGGGGIVVKQVPPMWEKLKFQLLSKSDEGGK